MLMVERYAGWLIRWRWGVVLFTLAWLLAAAYGASFLTFSNDYRVYFTQENPQLLAFEKLQNTYNKSDNALIIITPKQGDVFTASTLAAIEELTHAAWQIPYSMRVDSITNFQHSRGVEDDLVVADLVKDAAGMSAAELAQIRATALAEPLLAQRLISKDGRVTALNVTVQLPERDLQKEVPEVVEHLRRMVATFTSQHPDLEVRLTGAVMMNNAFSEAARDDLQTLVPLMFLVIVVVMALAMRTTASVVSTVLVIAMSIISAMGLAGWFGIVLTPPSVSAPVVIMTLSVANCMHLLTSYLHALYEEKERRAAMAESLRLNFHAFFLTNVTTVVGFLTMNFSEAPPFRDLGNILSLGVVTNYLLCITFLPAFMVMLPIRVNPQGDKTYARMGRFAEFIIRNRYRSFGVMALIAGGLIAFAPQNELNDNFVEYFDESYEFRRDSDYSAANLTGMYQLFYSVESGRANGITDPEYLRTLEAFAEWYRQQPEVLHVASFIEVMKRLNRNMHEEDPAYYRVPEDGELAAQYLLLYEMSLPFGLDLNDQLNLEKSATRMIVSIRNLSSSQILALETRAQTWLQQNAATVKAEGTGPILMFSYIGMRNIQSMLVGSMWSLLAISLVVIFALWSLRLGLISLIPNIVPILMAFGVWGIFVGQISLAASVVASAALGIIIDDTVHFLSKYKLARTEKGLSSEDAVRYAFSTVGTAIWYMTVVLVAGFLVLGLSGFELNSSLGILTAVTIAIALVVDFTLMPPLLMILEGKRHAKSSHV
jgi:hypothetical protein